MKSTAAWPLIICLLATLMTPAAALVGTEDAHVLARGECEAELVLARLRTPGLPTARGTAAQADCGIPWQSQISLAFARESDAEESVDSLELNGKTRLSQDAEAPLQFTLAWGGGTLKAPGESHRIDTVFLNLSVSHDHGSGWTTHANLGAMHSRLDRQDSTTWAVAAEKTVGGGVEMGAEFFGDDRSPAWRGLSVSWASSELLSLELSWARQGGAEGGRLFSAAIKLAF
jgi:hypothetical protein